MERKNLIQMIVAAGMLALSFSVPSIFEYITNGRQRREIRYLDELVVNTSEEYRTAVRQGEERGIKQIRGLISGATSEEAWVYLPGISEWRETGKIHYSLESEKDQQKRRGVLLEYKPEISAGHNPIIFYHMHLISTDQNQDCLNEALPSGEDLQSMITIQLYAHNLDQSIVVKDKIISRYGITECSLTENGIEHFIENPAQGIPIAVESRFIADISYTITFLIRSLDRGYTREKIARDLNFLCKTMSSDFLRVTFTLHE